MKAGRGVRPWPGVATRGSRRTPRSPTGSRAVLPPILTKLMAGPRRARTERRAGKRLAPGQPTPCLVHTGEEAPLTVWVHNLSRKGIGVLSTRAYDPGTALQVLLVNSPHT